MFFRPYFVNIIITDYVQSNFELLQNIFNRGRNTFGRKYVTAVFMEDDGD